MGRFAQRKEFELKVRWKVLAKSVCCAALSFVGIALSAFGISQIPPEILRFIEPIMLLVTVFVAVSAMFYLKFEAEEERAEREKDKTGRLIPF